MTDHERRAKNPLTGEELVVRHTINEIVDSACLTVLQELKSCSDPISQTDVARQADISRQAVSTHLAVLRDRGFVNGYEAGVELTAGGISLLDAIKKSLKTISNEELLYLTRSRHPIAILEALEKHSHRMSELQQAAASSPSRPTIGRTLETFGEYGWCQDNGRQQQITSEGTRVLDAYGDLEMAVEQFIKKAPWLQRLPPVDATFPPHELADAELVVSDPSSPAEVLGAALTLSDRRLSRFRGLCSIYNPILFHVYRGLLEIGVEAEAILDLPTYLKAAEKPQLQYAINSSKYEHYQPFVLDHAHTLGIGLYDDRKVAVGAYNEFGNGKQIAMIVSTNDQLVDWGIELYNSYQEKALPASEIVNK